MDEEAGGYSTAGEQPSKPKNPVKGNKPFVKGDPRINRKGRPKNFDALRALAQSIGAETFRLKDGKPVEVEGHLVTQAERALRDLLTSAPDKFLAIAYGPVPSKHEVTGKDGGPIDVTTMPPSEIAERVAALLANVKHAAP